MHDEGSGALVEGWRHNGGCTKACLKAATHGGSSLMCFEDSCAI
jgi:hypothetical protein